jgi:transcriptional regulator with XRE-family HTH domain
VFRFEPPPELVAWAEVEVGMARENFAHRLGLLRRERGLSRRQLAEHLAVAQPTVARMECGTFLPGLPTVARLARLLVVPVASLFADDR